jgi:hypothetical protein
MIDEHIEKIESAIKSGNLPEDKKAELLGLLPKLKSALGRVSETDDEHAENIAQIAAASADKVMTRDGQADTGETNVHGLIESVEGFEASHPQLVAVVNQFATVLSSMGV